MDPTTIAAIRAAMAEAGFAGAYDALAESHAELLEVLPLLMAECDRNWEEWTETDDRLLSHTPVGRGRAALTKARKL